MRGLGRREFRFVASCGSFVNWCSQRVIDSGAAASYYAVLDTIWNEILPHQHMIMSNKEGSVQ